MKTIIVIIILSIALLTGCSKDTPIKDTTIASQNSIETNSNTNSSLLDNIDTTNSPFEKGYYDYQGSINNNILIQMSIYPLAKDIVGTYFYEKQRKEIKLQGKAGSNKMVLYEYDDTGKNTGVFQGTMNTVDKISGTWTSADNKKSYDFTLSLKSSLPGAEYGKRYSVAVNTKSDQDVEDFVNKIQSYVVSNDKAQLAEQVSYPIETKINGKSIKIQNKNDFIMNYDQIFSPDFKQVISNAYTKYLFANWQGIMFGEGLNNIWINEVTPSGSNAKLMIVAINN